MSIPNTPNQAFYRQLLQATGREPVPLPGTGSALTVKNNAAALLADPGGNVVLPVAPVTNITPAPGAGGSTAVEPVANSAVVQDTHGDLGAGVLTWAKNNPLMAVGVAVGGYFLIKELLKGSK